MSVTPHTIFLDGDGIRWAAYPILPAAGDVPFGFNFTSQFGERRALEGVLADCVMWEEFDDHEWRELLMASRSVRPAAPPKRHWERWIPR